MPELPDITLYIEALDKRILGERLESIRIQSPFLLRTFEPPLKEAEGKVDQPAALGMLLLLVITLIAETLADSR